MAITIRGSVADRIKNGEKMNGVTSKVESLRGKMKLQTNYLHKFAYSYFHGEQKKLDERGLDLRGVVNKYPSVRTLRIINKVMHDNGIPVYKYKGVYLCTGYVIEFLYRYTLRGGRAPTGHPVEFVLRTGVTDGTADTEHCAGVDSE